MSVNTDLGFQYALSMPIAAEPFLPRTALSCRWAVVSPSACCYRQRGRADCHCRRMCHPAGTATGSAGAQTATAGGCVTQRELLHAALARRLPLAGGLSAECLSTCPWPVAGICSWPAPAVANHTTCATGKGDCAQRAPSILALRPMLQCMFVASEAARASTHQANGWYVVQVLTFLQSFFGKYLATVRA